MKKLKRTLALTLVLCMLCSLLPVSVLAAETAPTNNLSTTGSPFQAGTGDSNSFRIPALVTLSDGTLVAAADARWNTTYDGGGLDTMVAISTDNGASWTHSFANYLGDNGNAYNSASSCFIDPSLAVYTTDVDNDGIGEDTIYMLCDLYPNGVALNGQKQCTPSTQTGFNASGCLKLTTEAPSTSGNSYVDSDFTHYLKDGMIYSNDGTPVSGLSVDDYFNVTGTYNDQSVDSNLFFADSPFHVVRTGFLYLTKGTYDATNKTICWSAPTLLPLKTSSEEVCLVGPNGGMVTKSGVIVFPVYSYTGTTEQAGLIYSKDNGATWQRSSTFTGSTTKSSEADVVELDNGKLRVFYRNTSTYLCYADYDLSTNTWGNQVNTRVFTNSNTELSAITYSKTVMDNGVEKKMILVSCPASANLAGSSSSDGSWRTSGRIFAGLVDPTTCEMTWLDESVAVTAVASGQLSDDGRYADTEGFFAYSSMTEKKDGSVYILYENNQYGWGAASDGSNYYTITSKTFTESNLANELGVTFSGATTPDEGGADAPTVTNTVDVEIEVGKTSQVYTNTTGSTVVQNTDSTIATMKVDVVPGVAETTVSTTAATAVEPGATYIIRVTGTNQALTSNKGGTTWDDSDGDTRAFETFTAAEADNMWTLEASGNGYKLKCAAGYLNLGENAAWIDNAGEVFTLTYANGVWAIGDGTYNIDALGGLNSYHCAGGWPNSGTRFDLYKVTESTPASTEVSFTGVKTGKTTAVVGTTQYNITVTPAYEKVNVELMVGTSKTYTHTTGNEVITSPNQGIAKMDIATNMTISPVTKLESGKQYIIANTKTGKVLTDTVITDISGKWGDRTGLAVSDDLSANSTELWTVTVTENGRYTISQNGKYLVASGYYADMSTTATGLNVAYNTEKQAWTIMDNVTKEAPTEYFLSANVGDNYEGGVLATSATNNEYIYWAFYEVVPANTEITFTGVSVGQTVAVVGNTQYNITVTPGYTQKDVMLKVGQSTTYSDDSGVYDSYTITDPSIVDVHLEGGTQPIAMTSITRNDTFYIMVSEGVYLTKDYGTTTKLEEAETWTVTTDGGYYYVIKNSDGLLLGDQYNGGPVSVHTGYGYMDFNDGVLVSYYSSTYVGIPVKATSTNTSGTNITFTAKAEGRTTVVVGKTQYNITVVPDSISSVVNIELEIGEDYTYTDTSGNHTENIVQQPNGAYASMNVTATTNSTREKLVAVTAKTFETGKLYVIENVRTANPNHDAYQPNDSVLTATEVVGGATGLDMNGPLDVATSQKWSFTPSDNMYFVKANGEYIHIDSGNASMETTAQSLSFEYVAGSGWLIYYNADGNNTSDDGDYFLSDVYGTVSGEAFGYTDKDDDGNYWNIYEVVEETTSEATIVTFHGVAEGKTTAIVGSTQYNITVVPQETDDEVQNTATGIWTVDPEIQRQRYNTIINGKYKDLYTNESWKQYEAARQKAYKKLVEVTNAKYTSEADANTALDELTDLIDELEEAAEALVGATTISVHYTYNGTELDIREYKIASTETSVTLPDTIVVENIAYKVTDTTLERQGEETTYYVPVELIGKVGEGFVGSQDLNVGTHNGHAQITDLVDDDGNGKKITEMTVTVGISYDLDLGIEMKDGYTVEWVSDNTDIITVDQAGNVTAVGEGITSITATVKDAAGNIVEVNSIPVTVFPKGTADRNTAIYIEEVSNTTVWCVVNGDTQNYGFECVEGELIYGQFDTTVSDSTKTTAMSFFGDPDEAHALVYMKSTNSDDHYFQLHDKDGNMGEGVAGYVDNVAKYYYVSNTSSGAGYWQALGLNDNSNPDWNKIKDMVRWAINLGCDGGLGFTRRQTEGALASNLSFKSDPMPRIEKVVDGVLPTSRKQSDYRRYVENMVAAVNELVYFKITVTQEVPTEWTDDDQTEGAITYSGALVTDTILPGGYLYSKELDKADGTWDGEVAEGSRTQEDEITEELNSAWTEEQKTAGKRTFDYYLVYEIQESDIPKFWIDNIANLTYNYESHYSTGAQAAAADAEARISVVGSAIDNVVIDFGQKVVYQGHDFTSITDGKTYTFTGLRNVHLKGAFVNGENTECHAEATYGDVEVTREQLMDENGKPLYDSKGYPEYEYKVTYTPNRILLGPDAVVIYGLGENNQEKIINGFMVYPATTVYYEEGFMLDNNSSWDAVNGWSSNPGWDTSNAEGATVNQSFELLGMSQFDNHGMLTGKVSNLKHNYGFDPIYDGSTANGEAEKSSITADKVGDSTSFTFTGTGFELFADCTENSGYVNVAVVNAAGQTVKVFMVNTVVKGGESSATTGQTGNMDSLPIVSLKDLPHGTYTVTLGKVMDDSKVVTIDGVRITNTIADSSIYTIDLEDNPEFYQLRDYVLKAINIQDYLGQSMYYEDIEEGAKQVYADISTDSEAPKAVLTSVGNIYTGVGDEKAPQDLLDNGPKNEIYLWAGQTLTFNVTTSRLMQIGLKAPRNATNYTMKVDGDVVGSEATALSTPVDLFYELGNTNGTEHKYTISITNTGSDIVAITDLKICDDPTAAFTPLTLEDIENILREAGYYDGEEPEVPDEPEIPDVPMNFVDVPEGAYYYPPVVWAVKNGITNGISQSHFGSEMDCNRAQVVTFLWRAAGCPEPTITENPFVDVEAGSFYEKAVLWAVEKNITNGTDKTHFSPNLTCNRASVVTFLYRAFEEPVVEDVENPFTDVPAETWFTQPVLWAVEQEITNGIGGGLFGIDDVCNRAQIVTFLYRAYN